MSEPIRRLRSEDEETDYVLLHFLEGRNEIGFVSLETGSYERIKNVLFDLSMGLIYVLPQRVCGIQCAIIIGTVTKRTHYETGRDPKPSIPNHRSFRSYGDFTLVLGLRHKII